MRAWYFTGMLLYFTVGLCCRTNAQAERSKVPKHFGKINNIKPAKTTDSLAIPEGGLKIGDSIPEALWHLPLQVVNHPEGKDTITLNDYRGKLIILDFWATWCGSCIVAMPQMHEMQKQFGDSVVILASTYEDGGKAGNFLKTNSTVKDLHLYSLVDNNNLSLYFPHKYIPHNVWISPSGQLKSTTSPAQVTIDNIRSVLNGSQQPIRQKVDIDPSKPLFLNNGPLSWNEIRHHSLLIEHWYDGLSAGPFRQYDANGTEIGLSITNRPLLAIYEYCLQQLFRLKQDFYLNKNLLVDTQDTMRLHNSFSFALTTTDAGTENFYLQMLAVLNQSSGYTGTFEKRKKPCYLLKHKGTAINFKSAGGEKINTLFYNDKPGKSRVNGFPLSYLVAAINDKQLQHSALFLVNDTGFQGLADISISLDADSVQELNEQLKVYQLEIVKGEKLTDIFVIRSAGH